MFRGKIDPKKFFDVSQQALDVGREVHDRHTKGLCITCGQREPKPDEKVCPVCFDKAEELGMRTVWSVLKGIANS
jgi:hypothetical protein